VMNCFLGSEEPSENFGVTRSANVVASLNVALEHQIHASRGYCP
jgi:hypothetical protein